MTMTQGCCQHGLHSSTEQQGMNFALKSAAVDDCLVTVHLYVQQTLYRYNASETRLLSACFAQQHQAAMHELCPKECCSG